MNKQELIDLCDRATVLIPSPLTSAANREFMKEFTPSFCKSIIERNDELELCLINAVLWFDTSDGDRLSPCEWMDDARLLLQTNKEVSDE